MKKILLNGIWDLYFAKQKSYEAEYPPSASEFCKVKCTVPGNVELALADAGILPEDLYFADNINAVQQYEDYEWRYERTFDKPKENGRITLVFEGVDCLAEYWLNGEKIGASDNMLTEHEFDVTDKLKDSNLLQIRLRSAMLEADKYDIPVYTAATWSNHPESVNVRKAPHMYGWDIMPRAVGAGLWRDVYLCVHSEYEITQLFCQTRSIQHNSAEVWVSYWANKIPSDTYAEVIGKCGGNSFYEKKKVYYKTGVVYVTVNDPKLWWPKNYGEPNVYNATVNLISGGEVLCSKSITFGIRTAELIHTETTDGKDGAFKFRINGKDIMCIGTNWVPLDAFHSRDKLRLEKALELLDDSNSNIIRCWGGNVYECDEFYDFCDAHGIMVWQDFAMACNAYPQSEEMYKSIFDEACSVVKRLRHHASVVLWSGDNECDQLLYQCGVSPDTNILTRGAIAEAIRLHDKNRPYIPSSPYITDKVYKDRDYEHLPEDHLWGPRDYYKSDFYKNSKAHFLSEIGYHGCPDRKSIEKFIDKEHLWPISDNDQWILHSSDQKGCADRVMLMNKQIYQLFGKYSDNLDEICVASQISQAEAMKYFIERVRIKYPVCTGIIWWNLLDGWPQMSDAVVDYYFEKKLAYYYIRNIQTPILMAFDEPNDWNTELHLINNSNTNCEISYTVTDLDTGAEVCSGKSAVNPGENIIVEKVPVMYSDCRMFLIKWETRDGVRYNHYLLGSPPISLEKYEKWLNILKKYYETEE